MYYPKCWSRAIVPVAGHVLCAAFLSVVVTSSVRGDITGPDGLVYPDWSQAGIVGGIPNITTPVTDLSSRADDGIDDAAAIEAASAGLPAGGVVYLGPGTYHLDRPVTIEQSGIVLRGAGAGQTRLVFRWQGPSGAPEFTRPAADSIVKKNTYIQAFANPNALKRIVIKVNGVEVQSASRTDDSDEPICSLSTNGQKVITKGGTGLATLTVEAEYFEGPTLSSSMSVTLDNSGVSGPWRLPKEVGGVGLVGALTFLGGQPTYYNTIYSQHALTQTAVRGSSQLVLGSGHGFTVGSRLELTAPVTSRWNAETGNPISFGVHRSNQYEVTAVSGNTVTIDGALRIDFPLEDGPFVRRMAPIVRAGVEDLTLEHTSPLWLCGVLFSNAWECWARGVTVLKAGRHPLYMVQSKNCEIRDCSMVDAGWKGHGGSAYVGWDQSFDCLMENVSTQFLRHAPLVQWGASGNVVRNSTFYGSDAQFHAGYTHENLFENCRILSNAGDGGYGGAIYSAKDTSHGINGPRNVVYGCDFSAPNDGYYNGGCWFGGGNHDWMILHNRFLLDQEGGIYLKQASRDHLFYHNVWVLRSPSSGVQIETDDSTGVDVSGNTFVGIAADEFSGGVIAPAYSTDNVFLPTLVEEALTNPGFESGLSGWTQVEAGFASAVIGDAKLGAAKLRLADTVAGEGSTASSRLVSSAHGVIAGETYQVRYWAKHVAGLDTGGVVELQFLDAGGNVLRTFSRQTNDDWTTWRLQTITGDAPSGAASCRLAVRSYDMKTVTADFDGFRLGRLPVAVANSGFEGGLAYWDNTGDNGLSAALGSAAFSGAMGLRVDDDSASLNASLKSQFRPAVPGSTYQVRFRGRVVSGSGVRVWLRFTNAGGTLLAEESYALPAGPSPWRQYVHQAVAPVGTAAVRIRVTSHGTAGLVADFDDFVLLEAPRRPAAATPSIFEWQRSPAVLPACSRGRTR